MYLVLRVCLPASIGLESRVDRGAVPHVRGAGDITRGHEDTHAAARDGTASGTEELRPEAVAALDDGKAGGAAENVSDDEWAGHDKLADGDLSGLELGLVPVGGDGLERRRDVERCALDADRHRARDADR